MIDVVEGERVELSHVVGYANGEANLDVPGFGIAFISICLVPGMAEPVLGTSPAVPKLEPVLRL